MEEARPVLLQGRVRRAQRGQPQGSRPGHARMQRTGLSPQGALPQVLADKEDAGHKERERQGHLQGAAAQGGHEEGDHCR